MKHYRSRAVFKAYTQNQIMLLPPSLEELIEVNHPVRVVSQVIDRIDVEPLLKQYKGGGTSSYSPRMLLKVLVYSYLNNLYSSRKMEAALKENINFMWLSGMNKPDHNTLNRFRSQRLKDVLKEIFAQVVLLLVESGHISLQEIYTDGTKIEANANRYTFVWGKSIRNNKDKIAAQLKELWDYTQEVASEELKDNSSVEFSEIDAEKVKRTIVQIDKALKDKEVSPEVKKKLNYARKQWPERLEKYADQEEKLGKRNSYSKTDPDATFMRMKEDHLQNGQLKAGYNVQISTNNQFIVNYSHHQNPTDTTTLPKHIEQFRQLYNQLPHAVIADAGYGSEENYTKIKELGIDPFIKYNCFDRDQAKRLKTPYNDLFYEKAKDCYYCPTGKRIERIGNIKRITENGFVGNYARYQSVNCGNCPLSDQCPIGKKKGTMDVNHNLNLLKSQATELLNSEKGNYYRRKRGIDVEPVFGNIKQNKGFRRFLLKGLSKTEVETGLLAMAHNLSKLTA
jgi:transposase